MSIDPRPVFEYDQVLTVHDLLAIRNGYWYQFESTSKWRVWRRTQFYIAIGVLNSLLIWIKNRKLVRKGENDDTYKAV